MNRRSFITALGLAPVAGVMAARDAMAAPTIQRTWRIRRAGHFGQIR
jgi:hypothetical protein